MTTQVTKLQQVIEHITKNPTATVKELQKSVNASMWTVREALKRIPGRYTVREHRSMTSTQKIMRYVEKNPGATWIELRKRFPKRHHRQVLTHLRKLGRIPNAGVVKRGFPPLLLHKAMDLFKQHPDWTRSRVQQEVGCSINTVALAKKRCTLGEAAKPSPVTLAARQRELFMDRDFHMDILNLEMSGKELMAKYKVPYVVIQMASKAAGINPYERNRFKSNEARTRKEVYIFLRERGFTWADIANLYGKTKALVAQRAQALGLPARLA